MAESNSIQEGGILTLDRNTPGEFVVAGGNIKDGWKMSGSNLIVPDAGIKVERNSEIPKGIGIAGLTAETDDTGISKAVQNIIRDPGEFKVKTDEQKVEVLKTDLTKASRAMYNPGQYIANSLESHGHGDQFRVDRVTRAIFEREEKSKQYFDKFSGKTETLVSTGPGLMEKYLIEAVNCVGDHGLVSSEAPKFLSDHTAELLKKTRLEMEMEIIPEMPGLVETTIWCLNDEKINLDLETRKNLYEILEQVSIPESFTEELLETMDKKGDLGNDLALKLYFDLRKNKPESEFLAQQKERRRVLLKIMSGTPQEIFDDFPKITRLANCLVVGVDMDNLTEGKVGIEMEYKPDLEKMPYGFIPNRFKAGEDANGVIEIRTNDAKLSFDEDYMKSLYRLETWLGDQPKAKMATLHVHLDNEVHPKTRELMSGMLYKLKNGDNKDTEIWGMGFPGSASGLVNFVNFLAIGSKENFGTNLSINIANAENTNWNNLLGGYFCCRLSNPESRLAMVMAMRGEKKTYLFNPLELFDPLEVLQSINFGDIKGIEQLGTGLNKKQTELFEECKNIIEFSDNKDLSFREIRLLDYVERFSNNRETMKVIEALHTETDLPQIVLNKLLEMLENIDMNVRVKAHNLLGLQKKLPESVENKLVELMDSEKEYIRNTAGSVLGNQKNISLKIANRMVEMMGSAEENIQDNALKVLKNKKNLSEEVVNKVAEMIGDESAHVRYYVRQILKAQTSLPESIVDRMAELLDSNERFILEEGLSMLEYQKNLSEKNVDKVLKMMASQDEYLRDNAMEIMQIQENLSEQTIEKVLKMMKVGNRFSNESARRVLHVQKNLSDNVVNKLVEMMREETMHNKVLTILQGRTSLPESAIDKIMRMIDEGGQLEFSALSILINKNNLPEKVIDKLTELAGDDNEYIRENACNALQFQEKLPERTINRVTEIMDDEDKWKRHDALKVLKRQKNLSEKTIEKVMEKMNDSSETVKNDAEEVLTKQASLPEKTIDLLMKMFSGEDYYASKRAVSVLKGQTSLPERTIEELIRIAGDENEIYRYMTIDILERLNNVSKGAKRKIAHLILEKKLDASLDIIDMCISPVD